MNDRIQVIERAFKILEEIALDTSRPRTVGELAKETGLKIQTLSKIVRTMTVLGYLENVGRKSGYVLGEKFLQLSGGYREFDDLRPLVQPYLKKYAETVGEYISFSVLRGYYKHIVCRIRAKEADPGLRWHFPTEENPFDSLYGICLVARVGRAKQLKFCRKYPLPSFWGEISETEFLAKMKQIAQEECTVLENRRINKTVICCPVSFEGETIGCLGSFMPHASYTPEISRQLRALAAQISRHY